ncbi:MAG: hypothetical protein ACOYMA_13195 [Bacteroidia bacterium]
MKIQVMMAGNLAVINDIKNSPNKIIITCNSIEHGGKIIDQIKKGKYEEVMQF